MMRWCIVRKQTEAYIFHANWLAVAWAMSQVVESLVRSCICSKRQTGLCFDSRPNRNLLSPWEQREKYRKRDKPLCLGLPPDSALWAHLHRVSCNEIDHEFWWNTSHDLLCHLVEIDRATEQIVPMVRWGTPIALKKSQADVEKWGKQLTDICAWVSSWRRACLIF